ncbi:MAG: hypothetical protein H0W02_10020 [Ktedonobacteraceae bacterium]|nr:hypothetical protein [Ktedonobacteraceae bacterium]
MHHLTPILPYSDWGEYDQLNAAKPAITGAFINGFFITALIVASTATQFAVGR